MEIGIMDSTPRWEVKRLRYDPKRRIVQEHLDEGWEPFAAGVDQANLNWLWLRRQR